LKVILIVLDSVGIGEAPDASDYDDQGSATLQMTADAVGGLELPALERLGLGNIPALLPYDLPIRGVQPVSEPEASFGAMREVSEGKDTITGHWEIAGLEMNPGFSTFPKGPPSFSPELIAEFEARSGFEVIGNRAASGTKIIQDLGDQALRDRSLIVYTSSDSVFQIAAHTDSVPVEELYRVCEIAREMGNPLRIGRVIARPFTGSGGTFTRTKERKDFSYETSEQTILEALCAAGHPVYAVGKIEDIFNRKGITESDHTPDNRSSQIAVEHFYLEKEEGLIFANFIDFDMLYGHRRDPTGYAAALQQTDSWLGGFLSSINTSDRVIITADHGNDPTFKGADHTREYVPLLVYQPQSPGQSMGIRSGFYDIAQSLASWFQIDPMPRGTAF
jgi:phosphopentomutase